MCVIYVGEIRYKNMVHRNIAQLANILEGTILSQEGKILLD